MEPSLNLPKTLGSHWCKTFRISPKWFCWHDS